MRCFASPRPAAPHRAAPELPSKESSRGSRGLLCCRLQLLPQQTGPCRAEPVPTETCLIYSPKRAAGSLLRSSVLPSAAITSPRPTAPVRSLPIQAMPSLLSKESSRGSISPLCCCLQQLLAGPGSTLSNRTWPHQTAPRLAPPCLLSEESSRENRDSPCCRLQL